MEISTVYSSTKAFHLSSSVGLRIQQIALVILVNILHLLIREDYPAGVGFSHEEVFAESATALPEDLIREHGDDGSKGEDEAVDVLHIEEVSGHCIRNGVLRQSLCVILGQPHHLLGVYLNRVIVQLGLSHCLQSPRALRQEGITLHPTEAV